MTTEVKEENANPYNEKKSWHSDEEDKAFIARRMKEYKKNGPQYFSPTEPSTNEEGAGQVLWDEREEFQQRQEL